jgi:hypothetical protein
MNEVEDQDVRFEERLLAELRAVVEERGATVTLEGVERNRPYATESLHGAAGRTAGAGRRRLAPRLVFGGAAVAAVAAGVLAVSSGTGDTSSAFAVEPRADGEVRVEISSLSDAEGLEKALGEAGIKADVNYLAAGMACREPRFTPDVGERHRRRVSTGIKQTPDGATFSINRDAVGAGETLLVTAAPGSESAGDVVGVQVAEGAVSACDPVPASQALPPGADSQSNGLPPNGVPPAGIPSAGASQSGPQTSGGQQESTSRPTS